MTRHYSPLLARYFKAREVLPGERFARCLEKSALARRR